MNQLQIQHIQHYPIGGENGLKLELKHIAPYLPYGLKIYDTETRKYQVFPDIGEYFADTSKVILLPMMIHGGKYTKPLLRPLADLYKERTGKIDIVELAKIAIEDAKIEVDVTKNMINVFAGYVCFNHDFEFGYADNKYLYLYDINKEITIDIDQFSLFQYLFENHYDVFGLIEKGLSIDINTVEI